MLDRYIAAWQGRPCAIHEDDFDTQLPGDSPHGARDVPLACFSQVIKLCMSSFSLFRLIDSCSSVTSYDPRSNTSRVLFGWVKRARLEQAARV